MGEQPEGGGVDGEDQRIWFGVMGRKERKELVELLGLQAAVVSMEAVSGNDTRPQTSSKIGVCVFGTTR